MAIKITEECINCGACEPEARIMQFMKAALNGHTDGITVNGPFTLIDGTEVDAEQSIAPIATDIYYITPNKCTECQGFHEEPQCGSRLPCRLLCA